MLRFCSRYIYGRVVGMPNTKPVSVAWNKTLRLASAANANSTQAVAPCDLQRHLQGLRAERYSAAKRLPAMPDWCRRVRPLAATLMTTLVIMGTVERLSSVPVTASIERAHAFDEHDSYASRSRLDTVEAARPTYVKRHLGKLVWEKDCVESPLWQKKVDPAKYEYGCDEIEVRAQEGHAEVLNVLWA